MARSILSMADPQRGAAILTSAGGIVAGAGLGALLPAPWGLPVGLAVLGGAALGALLALDRRRAADAEALARNVGELNVRLAATRVKLDGLQSRVDSEPLREADLAPTRQSLAELTAEVGILGGLLRDVATTVADHDERLEKPEALPPPPAVNDAAPAPAAPALEARPAALVDAELRRRDEARLALILDAFSGGGLDIHLQPIAALPQRRTVGYEVLARLKLADGSLLTPAEFLGPLERAGQGAALDAQVLTRALAVAGHLNGRASDHFLCVNLSAATWGEARAVQSISRILETYRTQAARLVIEMPQRVHRSLDPARLGLVGAMAARGVRFAMDQVSDLRLDPTALADRGFRYVKTPAALLEALAERRSSQDLAGLDIDAADMAQLLRRAGVEMIGERAETDRQIADLMDLDIRLAQGFAISEPRPVRPEAFQPAQASVAEPAPQGEAKALVEQAPRRAPDRSSPERAPPIPRELVPERVPFRATLRRA